MPTALRATLLLLTACGDSLGPIALPDPRSTPDPWLQLGVPLAEGVTFSAERALTFAVDDPAALAARVAAGLENAGWLPTAPLGDAGGQQQRVWTRGGEALAMVVLPPPDGRVSLGRVAPPAPIVATPPGGG